MKKALSLSGGASRGSYQFGALKFLSFYENFDVIYGTSVGALNGAMYAEGKMDVLEEIWKSIKDKDVHRKGIWPVRLLFNGYLYNNKPLRKLIDKYLNVTDLKKDLYVTVVDMVSGELLTIYCNELSDTDYKDIVFASTIMPGIWKPLYKGKQVLADGGLRDNIPYVYNKDYEWYVLSCNPLTMREEPIKGFDIITRIFDIYDHEKLINDYVRYAGRKNTKFILYPDKMLGKRLDFNSSWKYIQQGFNDCKKKYNGIN